MDVGLFPRLGVMIGKSSVEEEDEGEGGGRETGDASSANRKNRDVGFILGDGYRRVRDGDGTKAVTADAPLPSFSTEGKEHSPVMHRMAAQENFMMKKTTA